MEKYSHGLEQDVSVIDLIGRCDIVSIPIVVVAFLAARLLPLWSATVVGSVATIAATMLCLRGLVQRIGAGHRVERMVYRVPGARWVFGL